MTPDATPIGNAKKRNTQAAIDRALESAKVAGYWVARFSISSDGTVTVETAQPNAVDKPASDVQPIRPKAWAKR